MKLPLPLPLVLLRLVIQLTSLLTVQLPEAVTETELPEEAPPERLLLIGETLTESPCLIVTVAFFAELERL